LAQVPKTLKRLAVIDKRRYTHMVFEYVLAHVLIKIKGKGKGFSYSLERWAQS